MRTPLQIFWIYSAILVIIPLIVAIIRFKKLTPQLRLLAILIFADFFSELISHVFFLFLHKSSQFLFPIFISVEFGLLAWIYRYEIRPVFIAKLIPVLIILFTGYNFFDWLSAGKVGLNPLPHFLECVFVLYFVLSFFYKTLKNPVAMHLERQPMFWLSVGLFMYFSGDAIIFIFSNYILAYSSNLNIEVWVIHAILNMFLYIFYTLALCLTPKKTDLKQLIFGAMFLF